MKKFFLFLMSAATLFAATSCSTEQFSEELPAGEQALVTFTADLGDLGSRATISDGTKVNEVAWAVYLSGAAKPLDDLHGTLPISEKSGTLELRLTTGRSYDIALFAYHTADATAAQVSAKENAETGTPNPSYYTIDWESKSFTINNVENQLANDSDNRDCFWFVRKNLEVKGPINETFTLKRPLAQLNFGSSKEDTEAARKAGVVVGQSKIVASSYSQFDMFSGLCLGEKKSITYKQNAKPAQDLTVIPNKATGEKVNYNYLGTVYLLLDQELQNVTLSVYENNANATEINQVEYSNVPLQRNFRTNIIGNLLTNPASFSIIVDEKFTEPDYIKNHWDGSVEAITPDANGVYSVANAANLAWVAEQVNSGNDFAGKTIVLNPANAEQDIDLNGIHWTPIGSADAPFRGTFDGNNYPICNLLVETESNAGLFGSVIGEVKNVVINNAVVVSSHYAGTVVGYLYGNVTGCAVDNVNITVTPNVVSRVTYDNGDKVGGIVGYVGEGEHIVSNNSVSNATITAYRDLGGIVGAGYITECKGNTVANAVLTVDQTVNNYGTKDANLGKVLGRALGQTVVLESDNTVTDVTLVYNPESLNPETIVPAITAVDKQALAFEGEGGSQSVTVTVEGIATLAAATEATWLNLTVDGNVVTVTATENLDAVRSANVTITYGEDSEVVTVSQAIVTPVVTVAEGTEVVVKAYGGSAVVAYQVVGKAELVVSDDAEWLTATNTENGISINANYSVAAEGRTATVTLTYGESVATFTVAQEEGKLYLKPNSNWLIDNARFAVYTWSPENWCDMPAVTVNGQTYYEVAVARVAANLIFCRMSSSATANNWNNKWNQTKDLTFPTNGNLYTIEENSWDNGNGTWSVLQAE